MYTMLTRSGSSSTEAEGEHSSLSQSQASSVGDSAPLEEIVSQRSKRYSRKPPTHVAQWVCILPEDKDNRFKCSFVSLKDPKTACARWFLLRQGREGDDKVGSELYEVMKVSDGPRSWFIGNSIQTDGSLHMCTRIDPLFLALPYLVTAAQTGKFTTLDNILTLDLEDQSTVCCRVLGDCIENEQWEHVTDCKELPNGMRFFKYSWPKTRVWLSAKVEALSCGLKREGVYAGTGSKSATLGRSSKQSNVSKASYLWYACGVISDYLPKTLVEQLAKDYPHPVVSSTVSGKHSKETDSSSDIPPTKKSRSGSSHEPLEDYSKVNVKSQAKQVPRAKQRNTKAISSFFSIKPS